MLKNGIMNYKTFEHSLTGLPQRGIVSPLLFNIQMVGFNEYIYDEFITPTLRENKNKRNDVSSKAYNQIKHQTDLALKKLKKTKRKSKQKNDIKKAEKEYKKIKIIANKIPYKDVKRLKRRKRFTLNTLMIGFCSYL